MSPRDRIVRATAELLEAGGRDAASTRAVSQAAGVQVPTIYRQFGDMAGLLDAVASHRFAEYLASKKARPPGEDPVDDLRRGWDLHVEFGVKNAEVYALMYSDPAAGVGTAALKEAEGILHGLVRRVAEAGRLRVGVELAARVIHSAGRGVTLTLIGMRPEDRDPRLSEITREAVLAALTTGAGTDPEPDGPQVATRAVALKAVLGEAADTLTEAEIRMMSEWLDRLAAPPPAR